MSWLLFSDESGHDHQNTPLEVRGGIAIRSNKIWDFVQAYENAENECFGVKLSDYKIEVKGSKLLKHNKFKWANQERVLNENERQNGVKRFLSKKSDTLYRPSRRDFTAYGQASLMMVDRIFDLHDKYEAKIFASCIPRDVKQPKNFQFLDFLRKDHVFLQERFFWFLEAQKEPGLFIMDQTEVNDDKRYIKRLHNYYTKTRNGKKRAKWIVPSPIFVDSALSPCIQAADICLYCINWGFRREEWNFRGNSREDIHNRYAGRCGKIQFSGDMLHEDGPKKGFGIIFVPNPYIASSRER